MRACRRETSNAGVTAALFQDFSDFVFIDWFSLVVKLQFVFGASHAENLEPVDLGHELGWTFRHQLREVLQKYVREAGSEVGAVDVQLFLPWNVHVLASWAVDFDPRGRQFLRDADRKDIMAFAEHSGAVAECAHHVLLLHHGEATWR